MIATPAVLVLDLPGTMPTQQTSANGERWTSPRAPFLRLEFTHCTTCAQRSVLRSLEALT